MVDILMEFETHGKIKELERKIINSGTICFFGLKKQLDNMNRFIKFDAESFIKMITENKINEGIKKHIDILFVSKARSKTATEKAGHETRKESRHNLAMSTHAQQRRSGAKSAKRERLPGA